MREDDLNLIRKLAWDFHRRTGIEYEELFSQASFAYIKAKPYFNKKRNLKMRTFCFIVSKRNLIDFCKREQVRTRRNQAIDDTDITYLTILPPSVFPDEESIKNRFSGDEIEIIDLALNGKYRDTLTPAKIRKLIMNRLIQQGWEKERVLQGFESIKKILK